MTDKEKTEEILLELGSLYEKHDLTFGDVFEVLRRATLEAEHYFRRQAAGLKFKVNADTRNSLS